jgi:hypothetical protein
MHASRCGCALLNRQLAQVLPDLIWLSSTGHLVSSGPRSAQPKILVNTSQPFVKDTLDLLGISADQVQGISCPHSAQRV